MEIAAYHEAGHAVLAVYLGGQVTGLSIETDEGWDVGNASVKWKVVDRQQRYLNDLKTALAGPVSEMIYVGDYDYLRIRSEHAADWEIVLENLRLLEITDPNPSRFLEECVADIYATIREDRIWSAVGDVAELLLLHDSIDGETVHEATEFWLRR